MYVCHENPCSYSACRPALCLPLFHPSPPSLLFPPSASRYARSAPPQNPNPDKMPPPRSPLLSLALLLTPAHSKLLDGVLTLSSQDTERYMGKFSFSPYLKSHISGSFHVDSGQYFDQHPHELVLCLYEEKQWHKFQEAMTKGSLCIEIFVISLVSLVSTAARAHTPKPHSLSRPLKHSARPQESSTSPHAPARAAHTT